MAYNIKLYVFIVSFIVLTVYFDYRDKSTFVDGAGLLKVVKHADDHFKEKKIYPEENVPDYEVSMKQRVEERRSAPKPKAQVIQLPAEMILDSKNDHRIHGFIERREVANQTVDGNGETSTVKSA